MSHRYRIYRSACPTWGPPPHDRESSLIKFSFDWRKYAALTEIADAIIDEPEGLFAGVLPCLHAQASRKPLHRETLPRVATTFKTSNLLLNIPGDRSPRNGNPIAVTILLLFLAAFYPRSSRFFLFFVFNRSRKKREIARVNAVTTNWTFTQQTIYSLSVLQLVSVLRSSFCLLDFVIF